MFCYFQFLIRDLARLQGANGDTGAIREHLFFETIDWKAVEEKRMKPPLELQIMAVSQVLYSFPVASFH